MNKKPQDILASGGPAKALALGCYGEDLAAYRYMLLAEHAEREQDRIEFRETVAEEQEHRDRLKALLESYFSGQDFVLTAEEKEMVESGTRQFQIKDRQTFEQAMRLVIESERMTAQFYDQMEPHMPVQEIKAIFRELADEGVEHHARLKQIASENDISFDG